MINKLINEIISKWPTIPFAEMDQWLRCDRGAGEDVVKAVTRKVNGGLNGIADRLQKFNLYSNSLV